MCAVVLAAAVPMQVSAQTAAKSSLIGTWTFDLKQGPKKDGPRIVIVRQDSSASYGTQTVRWRLLGDSLALALGGEWVNYRLKLKGKRLILSGGGSYRAGDLRSGGTADSPSRFRCGAAGSDTNPSHSSTSDG